MTNPKCRVCERDGWVCEEHRSHAIHACPSALILSSPCTCNPTEEPPSDFEIIRTGLTREDATTRSH